MLPRLIYFVTTYIKYNLVVNLLNIRMMTISHMHRIDEKPGDKWDLPRVAVDSLGAAMLVTIILDLWRIFLGPIVPISESKQCLQPGLAWFPGHTNQT